MFMVYYVTVTFILLQTIGIILNSSLAYAPMKVFSENTIMWKSMNEKMA